jgi:predicted AAA+ superfamily ATPase
MDVVASRGVAVPPNGRYLPRNLQDRVLEALADTRVVLISGARQVGKSTLAQQALAERGNVRMLTLDNPAVLSAAASDPVGFVEHDGVTVIDEVQHVPVLALAIKERVDRDQRPGQFLLTGSADISTIPQLAQALVGRMEILTLHPFSQGEVRRRREAFVDRLFGGRPDLDAASDLTRRDYVELAVTGGFPEVVRRPPGRRRSRWLAAYLDTLIRRDLTELAHIERLRDVSAMLRLAAARTGGLLNYDAIARAGAVAPSTARRWLTLLENLFVIARVPGWSNNQSSRVTQVPKLFVSDSGLAAHLLGVGVSSFEQPTSNAGPLLETFVAMELLRHLGWAEVEASLLHLRTRDGFEVDCVLEARDGRVVGVEVKSAATVVEPDFRGLRRLAALAGERFVAGAVLYTGRQPLRFGPALYALPMSALWAT